MMLQNTYSITTCRQQHVNLVSEGPINPCAAAASALPNAVRSPITSSKSASLVDPSPFRNHLTHAFTHYTHTKYGSNLTLPATHTHTHTTTTTRLHVKPASCTANPVLADHSKPPPAFVTAGGGLKRPSRLHTVHRSANTTILRSKHPHKTPTLLWLRTSQHQKRARLSTT